MNNSDEGRSCGLPRFQALFGSPRPSERGVRFGLLLASLFSLLARPFPVSSSAAADGRRQLAASLLALQLTTRIKKIGS